MLKNTVNSIRNMHKTLSANGTGVWRNNKINTRVKSNYIPRFFTNTASFCKFERGIFENAPNISYHLTGYGLLQNEALIRFLGESAERYSFTCVNKTIKTRLCYSSYAELQENVKESLILPLEYINIYKDMNIYENVKLTWVKMNSFNKEFTYVYIPAAFVVMGWELIKADEPLKEIKSVSTGSACHQSFKKALENSIVEYMQLDSTNLWWQSGVKGRKVDKRIIDEVIQKIDLDKDFWENFYIEVTDISFDKPIYIITCEIFSKKEHLPKYAIGIQGGLDIQETIYRGIMEGLTILEYAYNYKFIDEDSYNSITKTRNKFYDLDSNVIYYSKYGKPELNNVDNMEWNNEKYSNNDKVFRYVSDNYKYAGFLDITIDDFKSTGFTITRAIIPELLPLYLPSLVPTFHPRFKQYEVINNAPHPMP